MNYPPAFHLLAKPSGAVCNLDCAYCFFLSKELLYPGSRFRMADEMLETYLRQLIEAHQTPEVAVAWQGGEPMLMGSGLLRAQRRDRTEVLQAGDDDRVHDPDQRHADRRRVGRFLQGAQFSGGDQHRRAAGHARRLPRRQRRPTYLRQGDARAQHSAAAWRGIQHADDAAPRQRGSSGRGLSLPAATSAARASTSSSRSSSAWAKPMRSARTRRCAPLSRLRAK